MKIKKFRCLTCGGPKINPYTTPYIMCDFCGSFTDIDFAIGIETWNENGLNTLVYQAKKIALSQAFQNAISRGDRDEYYRLQWKFWDLYYKTFPAYLPPTIQSTENYSLYLEVCAVSSVESGFDPKWQQYAAKQQEFQNAIRYVQNGGKTVAASEPFFTLAEFFISISREGMRAFYENPRYAIMHRLLPESVHFKMKASMFVQAWIPYLTDADADKFIKLTGFSNEYVEIERPRGETIECATCRTELFAPDGSYRVFCEKCRQSTGVKSHFFCMSCGVSNQVPMDPGLPIPCGNCGIENRLIHPMFG